MQMIWAWQGIAPPPGQHKEMEQQRRKHNPACLWTPDVEDDHQGLARCSSRRSTALSQLILPEADSAFWGPRQRPLE